MPAAAIGEPELPHRAGDDWHVLNVGFVTAALGLGVSSQLWTGVPPIERILVEDHAIVDDR